MRLIDGDRLLETLEREEAYHSDLPQRADGVRDAIMDVMSAPTVDAVPVVMCKDCKHNPLETWFDCPLSHMPFDGDRWCWKGERKDDEQHG